jgi:hypothetical protein
MMNVTQSPSITGSPAAAPQAPDERPTRPAPKRSRMPLAILAGLALLGGVAGTALGVSRPREYQVSLTAQIDNVLAFPSWEANQATARFAQTLRRSDVKRTAAEVSGVEGSKLRSIAALSDNNSSLVRVELVTDDADRSTAAITALTDAALRSLAEGDRQSDRLLVDQNAQELAALDAQLQSMWASVPTAPGTDLGRLYNDAKFELETDRQELAVANEKWRIDQLRARIAVRQPQVDALGPLMPKWYAADTRRTALRELVRPATQRLQDHQLGMDLLASGDYRGPVDVSPIGRTTVVGRWAAGGVALGIAAALVLLALLALLGDRRRAAR